MEERKQKRKTRIKILAAVALIVALSLSGTLAYMTDYEAAENRFTVGSVDFNLYERNWDGELPDGSYASSSDASSSNASSSDASPSNALGIKQAEHMYAGKVIPKDPAIKNNSKNDAYVRMTVKIPVADVISAEDDGTLVAGGQAVETELFTYDVNPDSGMTLLSHSVSPEDNSHIYEYIYTGGGNREIPVPAGHDIPPLFNTVTFANIVGGQLRDNIEFIHVDFKAIQAGGFDSPEEAWAAYQNQMP